MPYNESPLVEALGAFFNNTLYTKDALVELLRSQIRRCEFVCPEIPLIPEMSTNDVDLDGYFHCVYNMDKFLTNTGVMLQPLYTRITQKLFSIWFNRMYFQPSPSCQ